MSSLPRFYVIIAVGAALASMAVASRCAAQPSARYLDTEVTVDKDVALVRCAFDLTSEAHRWYGVYYQFRLDGQTPLKTAAGAEVIRKWGDLFMPANIPTARWTNCTGPMPLTEIASAANLPKSRRTTLWAVCFLWNYADNKWLDSGGWNARSALIVTTDEAGKIVKAERFHTPPLAPRENHASERIAVKQCDLAVRHLKLKKEAGVYRALRLRHDTEDILLLGNHQDVVDGPARGHFFEPIDTPEKAAELAQLPFARSVVIRTPQQYQALLDSLAKVKGWKAEHWVKVRQPQTFGIRVTSEPELGYRVNMLIAYFHPYLDLGLRSVMEVEVTIAADGRLSEKQTVCIQGPMTPYGAPPGWEPEFGFDAPGTAKTDDPRSAPLAGRPNPTAAISAYNKALRDVLTPDGAQTIPQFVVVREQRSQIPCAAAASAQWYLNDIDQWPAGR